MPHSGEAEKERFIIYTYMYIYILIDVKKKEKKILNVTIRPFLMIFLAMLAINQVWFYSQSQPNV